MDNKEQKSLNQITRISPETEKQQKVTQNLKLYTTR